MDSTLLFNMRSEAKQLFNCKCYDQAKHVLADILFQLPEDSDKSMIHLSLGVTCIELEHFEEAEKWLKKSIEQNERHPKTYVRLAKLYNDNPSLFKSSEYDDDVSTQIDYLYHQACYLDPLIGNYHYGLHFLQLQQYKEAEECFLKSLDKDATKATCHYQLVQIYMATNDDYKVLEHFRICIQLQPHCEKWKEEFMEFKEELQLRIEHKQIEEKMEANFNHNNDDSDYSDDDSDYMKNQNNEILKRHKHKMHDKSILAIAHEKHDTAHVAIDNCAADLNHHDNYRHDIEEDDDDDDDDDDEDDDLVYKEKMEEQKNIIAPEKAYKLVFYGFDEVISYRKLVLMNDLYSYTKAEVTDVLFGGCQRVESLEKHFQRLQEHGMRLVILSRGYSSDRIYNALERVGLNVFFANVVGKEHASAGDIHTIVKKYNVSLARNCFYVDSDEISMARMIRDDGIPQSNTFLVELNKFSPIKGLLLTHLRAIEGKMECTTDQNDSEMTRILQEVDVNSKQQHCERLKVCNEAVYNQMKGEISANLQDIESLKDLDNLNVMRGIHSWTDDQENQQRLLLFASKYWYLKRCSYEYGKCDWVAINLVPSMLMMESRDAELHRFLAVAMYFYGHEERSKHQFHVALQIDDSIPELCSSYATFLFGEGYYEQAKKQLEHVILAHNHNHRRFAFAYSLNKAKVMYARVLELMGCDELAEVEFKGCVGQEDVQLDGDDRDGMYYDMDVEISVLAHYYYGLFLFKHERMSEAKEMFDVCSELRPNEILYHWMKSQTMFALEEFVMYEEEMKVCLRMDSQYLDVQKHWMEYESKSNANDSNCDRNVQRNGNWKLELDIEDSSDSDYLHSHVNDDKMSESVIQSSMDECYVHDSRSVKSLNHCNVDDNMNVMNDENVNNNINNNKQQLSDEESDNEEEPSYVTEFDWFWRHVVNQDSAVFNDYYETLCDNRMNDIRFILFDKYEKVWDKLQVLFCGCESPQDGGNGINNLMLIMNKIHTLQKDYKKFQKWCNSIDKRRCYVTLKCLSIYTMAQFDRHFPNKADLVREVCEESPYHQDLQLIDKIWLKKLQNDYIL